MSTSTPEMISTLVHLSHPQHPLTTSNVIEECDVTDDNYGTCYHCYESVEGDPTFSCTSDTKTVYVHKSCCGEDGPKCCGCNKSILSTQIYICTKVFDCQDFFLHKSCAELPILIQHHKHNQHPLTLLPRRRCICNVCGHEWKFFTYTCDDCDFHVCMFCAFLQRVLHHEGHHEHTLTLMQREALCSDVMLVQRKLKTLHMHAPLVIFESTKNGHFRPSSFLPLLITIILLILCTPFLTTIAILSDSAVSATK